MSLKALLDIIGFLGAVVAAFFRELIVVWWARLKRSSTAETGEAAWGSL